MNWQHLYQHIYHQADIRLLSDCAQYRKLGRDLPSQNDRVLEIGCSSGECTKWLATSAKEVLAVDISELFLEKARERCHAFQNIQFAFVDARDTAKLKQLMPKPDFIFLDIGGDAPMSRMMMVLRACMLTFTPKVWVVRNIELAIISSLITQVNLPPESRYIKTIRRELLETNLDNLLDLSYSDSVADRAFATRQLLDLTEPAAIERIEALKSDDSSKVRRLINHKTTAKKEQA